MPSEIETRPAFPLEMLHEVISSLASPDHCLAHGHKPDVQQALHQLCLCSSVIHDIAMPYLYSAVIVSNAQQLMLFHRTVSESLGLRRHIRSLSLPDFPNSTSPHLLAYVVELIDVLSPHLRRLMLDRPLERRVDVQHVIWRVLAHCHHLVEFSNSISDIFWHDSMACWSSWRNIRRLALRNVVVTKEFLQIIHSFPNLTHLVIDDPRVAAATESSLMSLLGHSKPLQRTIVIRPLLPFARDTTFMVKVMEPHMGPLGSELVFMEFGGSLSQSSDLWGHKDRWVQNHISAGTIWDLAWTGGLVSQASQETRGDTWQ